MRSSHLLNHALSKLGEYLVFHGSLLAFQRASKLLLESFNISLQTTKALEVLTRQLLYFLNPAEASGTFLGLFGVWYGMLELFDSYMSLDEKYFLPEIVDCVSQPLVFVG